MLLGLKKLLLDQNDYLFINGTRGPLFQNLKNLAYELTRIEKNSTEQSMKVRWSKIFNHSQAFKEADKKIIHDYAVDRLTEFDSFQTQLAKEFDKHRIVRELKVNPHYFINYHRISALGCSYDDFMAMYFLRCELTIEKARESLLIIDDMSRIASYISSARDRRKNRSFIDHYVKYLNRLNSKFNSVNTDVDFEYSRYIQIDLGKEKIIDEEVVANIIEGLKIQTLNHYWKCFNSENIKFKLFVTAKMKHCSYLIADKKVILTEYTFQNLDGYCYPDQLFINTASKEKYGEMIAEELIASCEAMIANAHQNEGQPNGIVRIEKNEFRTYLKGRISSLELMLANRQHTPTSSSSNTIQIKRDIAKLERRILKAKEKFKILESS